MLYRENVNAEEVAEHIKGVWQSATAMEPAAGKVTRDDVALLRSKLDALPQKVQAAAPGGMKGDRVPIRV